MVRRLNEGRGKSDLKIDMWYGDKFSQKYYGADARFYPDRGCYAGNIYRLSDGSIVGDYTCSDSVVIERELGVKFNESRRSKANEKSMEEVYVSDYGDDEDFDDDFDDEDFDEDDLEYESIRLKRESANNTNRVRYLPVAVGKRLGIENYPSFSASGSVSGMRKQYYGDDALLVRCGSYIYNVTDNPNIYYRAK